MKHKPLVIAKYPRAVCIRSDLGGAYQFTVYSDIYGGGVELATGTSAASAWKNADEKALSQNAA